MGIKGLNQFLAQACPDYRKEVEFSDYSYKKIAVDAMMYTCQVKAAYGDKMAEGLVNLLVKLREYQIHPVFIFDGETPDEKIDTRAKRAESKRAQYQRIEELETDLEVYLTNKTISPALRDINNTKLHMKNKLRVFNYRMVRDYVTKLRARMFTICENDFILVKKILGFFNIPFYTAPGEGEMLCAKLAKQGDVDAVLTNDTDCLAAGAPEVLSITKGCLQSVKLATILESLNLDEPTWRDFCIMCGTDFNENIRGIGPHKSYELIKKYGSIENIPIEGKEVLKHIRTRELFTLDAVELDIPFCGKLNFDQFSRWVFKNKINVSATAVRRKLQSLIVVKS